jgi:hypothetical protein
MTSNPIFQRPNPLRHFAPTKLGRHRRRPESPSESRRRTQLASPIRPGGISTPYQRGRRQAMEVDAPAKASVGDGGKCRDGMMQANDQTTKGELR